MESNLADAFASKVNCNTDTAYTFLHANQWDMDKALINWRDTQDEIDPNEPEIDDKNDVKKLSRGISRATDNVNLVSKTRCEFAQNLKQNPFSQTLTFIESTGYSFMLPDLRIYGEEFVRFLEKDLIDKSALASLEESKRLNWWTDNAIGQGMGEKLWPLLTTGDGNCLLHAASLAIWGFHDRLLTLREALHEYLDKNPHMVNLYRRWKWQSIKMNELNGFSSTEEQLARDWRNIINMASAEPRNNVENGDSKPSNNNIYESLEEFHVLALAHILRRPIVVVADIMLKDMNNEPFSPIHFGGIYLPLECSPKQCHRSPLLLTFDKAHFCALVPMENLVRENKEKQSLIPLTDSEGMLLPVQFCVDPGPTFNWDETYEQSYINSLLLSEKDQIALLKKYLDIVDLSETDNPSGSPDVDSEEEIERKFVEIQDFNDGEISIFGHKNRATKQLQSVARQFGSIGKSMSKKLKKNFGSITKPKPKRNDANKNRLICAEIHAKRHENHEQMIKNYLTHIQKKFLSGGGQRAKVNGASTESMRLQQQAFLEGPMKCINTECHDFGTVLTAYMCEKCYETQRNQELNVNSDSRMSAGKSKFYRDTDFNSYDAVRRLPVHRPIYQPDQTLYLLKSTFYYDNDKPDNNNHRNNHQMITPPRIEDISEGIDLDMRENTRKNYPNSTITSYDKENYHPDESANNKQAADGTRHTAKMDVILSPAHESNNNNNAEKRQPFTQNDLNHLINDTVKNNGTNADGRSIYKDEQISRSILENKYVTEDIMRLGALPDRPKSQQQQQFKNMFGAGTESAAGPANNFVNEHNNSFENNYKNPLFIQNEREYFERRFSHLYPCKTNSCPNIASEYTNYFCTDCWKRQF